MPTKPRRLAVLVDLDPEEPKMLGRVLAKAAEYGPVAIRYAYGNCEKLSDWRNCLQYHEIEPRPNYGDGANAADITLVIDAVYLLCSGKADGFCIAASDHHFTGLVRWLHDNGAFVAGIGRPDASPELRTAFGDNYTNNGELPSGAYGGAERALVERIRVAIEDSKLPNGYAYLSRVKDLLGDLDAKVYCHGSFASLVESYGEFEVRDGIFVRIRPAGE